MPATNRTGAADADYRAVVHFNDADPDKQSAALRNVRNLRADLGPDARIEIVVHGPAIGLAAAGHRLERTLRDLVESGVGLAACGNSLRSQHVGEETLLTGVTVVSSGVGHLVRRQHEGWAYVRP